MRKANEEKKGMNTESKARGAIHGDHKDLAGRRMHP